MTDRGRRTLLAAPLALVLAARSAAALQSWPLLSPQRTGIHDVAPAPDGTTGGSPARAASWARWRRRPAPSP